MKRSAHEYTELMTVMVIKGEGSVEAVCWNYICLVRPGV